MKRPLAAPARMAGLSLIELMIALLIGTLLIFGLIQLFTASRTAYQLSEGLSRVQENGRFAVDFLQRDLRIAGHFGCVNDQAHTQTDPLGLATTFSADSTFPSLADHALRFDVSIEGFDATGTAPEDVIDITAAEDGWNGGFAGSAIEAATPNRVAGSDIVVLRYLVPEGVPVTDIVTAPPASPAYPQFNFDASRWDVLRSGVSDPGLFAVADCLSVTVFQSSTDPSTGLVMPTAAAPLNQGGFHHVYTPGQTMLHRVESMVYYVGTNGSGGSSLYRARYQAAPNGAGAFASPEELVEGIENMQFLYGFDREDDTARPPTGFIDRQSVALSGADSTPERWRRSGAVQVALLGVSDRAGAPAAEASPILLGTSVEVPADGRLRSVYQSTIAVRNRLYGN